MKYKSTGKNNKKMVFCKSGYKEPIIECTNCAYAYPFSSNEATYRFDYTARDSDTPEIRFYKAAYLIFREHRNKIINKNHALFQESGLTNPEYENSEEKEKAKEILKAIPGPEIPKENIPRNFKKNFNDHKQDTPEITILKKGIRENIKVIKRYG